MAIFSPLVRSTIAAMIFVAISALSVRGDTVPWTSPVSARATSSASLSSAAEKKNLDLTLGGEVSASDFSLPAGSTQNLKAEELSRSSAAHDDQPPAAVSAPLPTPAWSTAVLLVVAFLVVRRFKRKLV